MNKEFAKLDMTLRGKVIDGMETFKFYSIGGRYIIWHIYYITKYKPMPFSSYSGPIPVESYFCNRNKSLDISNIFNSIEEAVRALYETYRVSTFEIKDYSTDQWVKLGYLEFREIVRVTNYFTDKKYNPANYTAQKYCGVAKAILTTHQEYQEFEENFEIYQLNDEFVVKHRYFLEPNKIYSDFKESQGAEEIFSIDLGKHKVSEFPSKSIDKMFSLIDFNQVPEFPSIKEAILAMCMEFCATVKIQKADSREWTTLTEAYLGKADPEEEKKILAVLNNIF